jgi:hypothetical protein
MNSCRPCRGLRTIGGASPVVMDHRHGILSAHPGLARGKAYVQVGNAKLFGGGVRIAPSELGELSEHADVGVLSPLTFPVNLEIMLESDSDRKMGP